MFSSSILCFHYLCSHLLRRSYILKKKNHIKSLTRVILWNHSVVLDRSPKKPTKGDRSFTDVLGKLHGRKMRRKPEEAGHNHDMDLTHEEDGLKGSGDGQRQQYGSPDVSSRLLGNCQAKIICQRNSHLPEWPLLSVPAPLSQSRCVQRVCGFPVEDALRDQAAGPSITLLQPTSDGHIFRTMCFSYPSITHPEMKT